MICAYFRMKLSSLKMNSDRVFEWRTPGIWILVALWATLGSDPPRPPATPTAPSSPPPVSLSAVDRFVILTNELSIAVRGRATESYRNF